MNDNHKDAHDAAYIVYPEQRWVSLEQLQTWFTDAVANGSIAPEYLSAKGVEDMGMALDDAGVITLGRPPQHY